MKITSKRKQLVAILGVCMAIFLLIALTGESQAGPEVLDKPPQSETPTDWSQAREVFSEKDKAVYLLVRGIKKQG